MSRFIAYHSFSYFPKKGVGECCLKSFLEQGRERINGWMHERLFIWNASVRIKPSHSPLLGFLDHHLFSVSVLCVSAPHCFECSVSHLYNRRSSRDSLGGIGKNCHPRWFHGALASIPIPIPHTQPSATPPNPSPQVSHFFQGKH